MEKKGFEAKILRANTEKGDIYGLFRYQSMFQAVAEHICAKEARFVYEFKKYGKNEKLMRKIIEKAKEILGCDEIVAVPGHGVETNRIQGIFGSILKRKYEVQERKYSHAKEIDANYGDSLELGEVKGKKILLLDDVTTTGKSLNFYRDFMEKRGFEVVPMAIGMSLKLKPEETNHFEVEGEEEPEPESLFLAPMDASGASATIDPGKCIDFEANREICAMRKALKKLIPIKDGELLRAREILADFPEQLQDFERLAREASEKRVGDGKRLQPEQVAALQLLDPALAMDYAGRHGAGASSAMTGAERVSNWVARHNDIGEIPDIKDRARRDACASSLLDFGKNYCQLLLKHEPSDEMKSFITLIQECVLHGGRIHERWPRGMGKTTWVKIGIIWAVAYGFRHFVVAFASGGDNAKKIIEDVWNVITTSNELCEDFPEMCYPVRKLGGIMQRCGAQTYHGELTKIYHGSETVKLPTIPGSLSSGAMMIFRSVGSGTRGMVNMKMRPDFIFFDDPQTPATARSKVLTQNIEDFIQGDAMGLAGHDKRISALMASTPIKENDLSERYANSARHPEWITQSLPLVLHWPDNMDLVDAFSDKYKADVANRDVNFSLSREFYKEKQAEIEKGAKVLDPKIGDSEMEYSAFHHCLNLLNDMGRENFFSEYQMQPKRTSDLVLLAPENVCRRLNGENVCMVPEACRHLVAFCDVNARAGMALRWAVMAVGPGRVCAIVAYGKYPREGRLYPVKSTQTAIDSAIANGILNVQDIIAHLPLLNHSGVRRYPATLCFDGGWETKVVSSVVNRLKNIHFNMVWSKGFGWRDYRPFKHGANAADTMLIGDHCHLSAGGKFGDFISYCSDYWREVAQRSFLALPMARGSVCFWGADPSAHYAFAEEVCAEKLIEKGINSKGEDTWEWQVNGENHWGDVLTGCFFLASYYGFYDATDEVIERVIEDSKIYRISDLARHREEARAFARKTLFHKRFHLVHG